ncbi:hypothetical protein [Conchiformibius kuhniae]|uniref:Lipoprotein n=1 Tax=Conchiformibius kuhniae TaxID=211502 RepID=A0A8T9MXT1_9NEIS|nr:hypothetical protein [Conchiformibius kuhniae]UOP04683.1 hypothetical protein LVJ77_10885 [Conchiformibius kuhniae]
MAWQKILCITLLTGLLAACAAVPAPQNVLAQDETRWFQVNRLDADGGVAQTSLLSVQGLADGQSRWLLADAFGAPQARLLAGRTGWRQDGFAPPNRAAQKLFAALSPHVAQGLAETQKFNIEGIVWQVSPLEMQP